MTSKNRRRLGSILGLVFALALSVALIAPGLAQGQLALGQNVRWDLVNLQPAGAPTTALPGGSNTGLDATGDTLELTGSGNAIPALGDATGGGTFVHRHAGSVVAQGFYLVTGFVSWQRRAGTFPSFLTDGIGHASQGSAGLLTLNVRFFATTPAGLPPLDGVLTIHCHFPDTPGPGDEGIEVTVASFHFLQAGGVTVFHVFR